MQSGAFNLIREAIETKQQVIATYGPGRRGLCPHALGWKNGQAHALFFQFFGESASGLGGDPRARWRCLRVDALEDIRLRRGRWYTAVYDEGHSCIDELDLAVDGFQP